MSDHNDPLTGLPDHLALDRALKPLIGSPAGVAVAALDLDHFLEINTTFGAEVGDQVLRTLACLLDEREPGQVYRISGDEFVVVMPGLGLEEAFLRVEALRKQIVGAPERFGLPDQRVVTIK